MKHLRIIGMVALAALALMALAGTASASADVLCKGTPNKAGECRTEFGDYASGATFTFESEAPKLTVVNSIAVSYLTCASSTIVVKSTSTGGNVKGEAISGEVADMTFSGCKTDTGTACVIGTPRGYTGVLTAGDNQGDGKLESTSSITTEVLCGSVFECRYKVEPHEFSLNFIGGNPAAVTAVEQHIPLEEGGFGCGSEAKLDATFRGEGENTPLYIATRME